MKKSLLVIIIFTFWASLGQQAFAQEDTTQKNNDSLNAVILNDYNVKLAEIAQQHIADSVRKAQLEAELNQLKTTDNLKKGELQEQLEELRQKEENRIAQKKAQIDALRSTAKGYPVNGFFNDTLFFIYSKLGSFSAKDRAAAIGERVHKLADNFYFHKDSLKLAEVETTIDILFRESIIMSISENDAIWNSTTKDALALRYKNIIGNAVVTYKSETSLITLAKEIGLAALILVLIGVLIYYLGKLFKWTAIRIRKQEGNRIKGIKIRNYTLFDAEKQVNALLTVNTIVKWIVILLVVYLTLPILFGIFPWTKNFADTLFGYVLNPLKSIAIGIWHYLPNLFTIAVIIFVFRYVLKGLHFLKTEVENEVLRIPGFYPDWANPTYHIIRILVFAFMIVVIFPYLPGSESPIFKGVSVFLGFLLTFGSAGSLSNIVAGLVLTYMRLFRVGDRVKIGDVVGDVVEKSLLVTRIRTPKNEIVSISNSTVMSSHAVNYSLEAPEKGLIIYTTVTIGYDVPWRKVHDALISAAKKTNMLLDDPKPFVLQTSLDDFYVSYQINAYTREPNKQPLIYSLLHQNIQDACNENGIEILSPHYRAARDGNMTTIPADYLPKDYQAPGFNVNLKKEE